MKLENLVRVLPTNVARLIEAERLDDLEEIRVRTGRKTILKFSDSESVLDFTPDENAMIDMLQRLCDNSIYSYQSQICNGFITLYGGHRVGITGNMAMKDGKIFSINYVSSLNFRIAREVEGACVPIVKYVVNRNDINNALIISKPGCGKTTVLRDLVRTLSNVGVTISLIDERGEIAAMYKGMPQNDVGSHTDVMDNVTKSLGMKIAVRTMAPDVIVADEIGSSEDVEAINYGVCSGVKGIFTAHAGSIEELVRNENLKTLYDEKLFKMLIFLEGHGKVKNVYELKDEGYEKIV